MQAACVVYVREKGCAGGVVADHLVVNPSPTYQLGEALERQKSESIDSPAYARTQAAVDFANAKLRLVGHH